MPASAALPSRRRSRGATCPFADVVMRVAETAGQVHAGTQSKDCRYCMAAFLLTDCPGAPPVVVAMGSGTKFLPFPLVLEDKTVGRRVHDCHAEPLARRALLRWLHLQILALLDAEAAAAASPSLNAEASPTRPPTPSQSHCLLRRRVPGDGDGASAADGDVLTGAAAAPFELRPGAALHLYCSSCPCGNASLRRWAQAGKGGEASLGEAAEALPEGEWPHEHHTPLSRHALREGQVQLLVKRDPGRGAMQPCGTQAPLAAPEALSEGAASGYAQAAVGASGRGAAVSCGHAGILPPGTELPGEPGAGVMLTCSDKLALWSALGVQGALLSRFIHRLCPATVTVGRKFSRPHLRRALCCRLSGWHGSGADSSSGVAHPTILSPATERVFDDQEDRDGPAFGSGASMCWWQGCGRPVRLDGRSGLLLPTNSSRVALQEVSRTEGSAEQPCSGGSGGGSLEAGPCTQWWTAQQAGWLQGKPDGASPLSKAALLDAYEGICARLGLPAIPGEDLGGYPRYAYLGPPIAAAAAAAAAGMSTETERFDIPLGRQSEGAAALDGGAPCSWAQRYQQSKRKASPWYNADREELLTSPLYFVPAEGTVGHPAGEKRRTGTGYRRKVHRGD